MDDEAVEGIADADTARLGVEDDGRGFVEVGSTVDIAVDNAGTGFDDGHLGVLADIVDKTAAAARYGW